tara:strand:+ start:295 stop:2370 length:2076 start_codon:yes stop_codon:yes gene_type:complete
MIIYRREIDGLRAIAVLSVLLYHAGFTFFRGGYVGVDIFFVISGYLITSLILKEKNNNEFSLLNFYERRIRRILPALFFVTLVTVPFSFLMMPPVLLKEFANSVISIPLFLSNFLFWSEGGYFATAAEEKPLLHTWSLAVEEQYYLIFPIFVIIFWRFGKLLLITIIIIVTLLSILLAQFGGNIDLQNGMSLKNELKWISVPEYAFYLTPTRAWEILLGSLTAFYLFNKNIKHKTSSEVFSILGIILIIYSILTFSASTPFPSFFSLIPTIGTVLLIIFSIQGTITNSILSSKYFVGMGLISYSVYLWHQPLLVYFRLYEVNALDNLSKLIIIFLSIFLGYLSWRYVETPFRDKKIIKRKAIFSLAIFFSVLLVYIGMIIIYNDGFKNRFTDSELEIIEPSKYKLSQCSFENPIKEYPNILLCTVGYNKLDSKPIIFLGDSHMDSLINIIDLEFQKNSLYGFKVINNYCEPMIYTYRDNLLSEKNRKKCSDSHDALLKYLQSIKVEDVFILYRWTFRLYPIENYISSLTFDNGEGGIEYVKHYREYYAFDDNKYTLDYESKKKSIKRLIKDFNNIKIKTHLLYPIPESGWNMSKYNMNKVIKNKAIPNFLSTSYEKYLIRNRYILEIFDEIKENEFIFKFRSDKIFCDSIIPDRCVVQLNGKPLYYDSDHLSDEGARLIVKQIINQNINND